jgi:hypothetical protein
MVAQCNEAWLEKDPTFTVIDYGVGGFLEMRDTLDTGGSCCDWLGGGS